MAVVMIGVDPHKGSHTAVAVDGDEAVLGLVRVRASAVQAQRLLEWAAPERTLCGPAGRVIAGHPSDSAGGGRRAVMPEAAEPRAGGVSACSGSHVCPCRCQLRRPAPSRLNRESRPPWHAPP